MILSCVKRTNTKNTITKYTNTQIQHKTKCQKDPTWSIFLKRELFKDIKNYIPIKYKLEYLSFAQLYEVQSNKGSSMTIITFGGLCRPHLPLCNIVISQIPQPTCYWKWVGFKIPLKQHNFTLRASRAFNKTSTANSGVRHRLLRRLAPPVSAFISSTHPLHPDPLHPPPLHPDPLHTHPLHPHPLHAHPLHPHQRGCNEDATRMQRGCNEDQDATRFKISRT